MNGLIRMAGQSLHGFEAAGPFLRALFGCFVGGPKILRTAVPGLRAWRALFGGATMLLSFYAFTPPAARRIHHHQLQHTAVHADLRAGGVLGKTVG